VTSRALDATAAASTWTGQRSTPGSQRATSLGSLLRWNPLEISIALSLLTGVWRFQMFIPVIAKLQIPILASAATVWFFVAGGGLNHLKHAMRHPVSKWVAVMFGLMALSVPTSLYPGLSFRSFLMDHARDILLMLIIAASARKRVRIERIALVVLLGGVGFCLAVWKLAPIGSDGRLGDFGYYDANDMAMMLVCSAPFAVYFLRRGVSVPLRAFALAALALFMVMFVKSGSRGGFIGLLAVSGFMLFDYTAIPRRVRWGAVTAAGLLLFTIAGNSYWSMMGTLLHPTQDYNWTGKDNEGRMEVWRRGIGYMLQRPITGVGVNAFAVAEGTISPLADLQARGIGVKWSAAHNSFVQIGAELGVGGLLALIMTLWRSFQALRAVAAVPRAPGRRVPPEVALAQSLQACLVGYIVAGFFLSQAYSALLYVLLGLVVGVWTAMNTSRAISIRTLSAGRGPGSMAPARGR